jgi:hypothetical protein
MIRDFELVKKQLAELSQVVNSFKSEAVQLRIVELILGGTRTQQDERTIEQPDPDAGRVRKSTRKRSAKAKSSGGNAATIKSGRKPRGGGATDVLRELADSGFFKTPRLIGDIVEHCKVKLAKPFKPNELSPGLGRLVREKILDRDKDKETKQFKYFKK